MEEPYDHETARRIVRRILGERGMTTFGSAAKEAMMREDLTSADVVNVLRGGAVRSLEVEHGIQRYRSRTKTMSVDFAFRGPESGRGEPDEVVIVGARRHGS
ncbi:MAG TPA: hypothetical protein VFV19_03165 [Candidatus Polarisedimenticolaceae bacterium]|nr:hypothetical protein [Candidatus Polarisedimenticolaceae bacterium]